MVLIGLVLQVLGTALALWGLVKTWRVYSTEPLWPAWARGRVRLRGLQARVRGLLRGRRPFERHAADSITFGDEAVAKVARGSAWDGLPSDHDAAIRELDRRVRALSERVGQLQDEFRPAIDRLRSELGLGLDEEARERQAADKAIAIGGARTALVGVLLIIAGLGFQVVALLWALVGGTTA